MRVTHNKLQQHTHYQTPNHSCRRNPLTFLHHHPICIFHHQTTMASQLNDAQLAQQYIESNQRFQFLWNFYLEQEQSLSVMTTRANLAVQATKHDPPFFVLDYLRKSKTALKQAKALLNNWMQKNQYLSLPRNDSPPTGGPDPPSRSQTTCGLTSAGPIHGSKPRPISGSSKLLGTHQLQYSSLREGLLLPIFDCDLLKVRADGTTDSAESQRPDCIECGRKRRKSIISQLKSDTGRNEGGTMKPLKHSEIENCLKKLEERSFLDCGLSTWFDDMLALEIELLNQWLQPGDGPLFRSPGDLFRHLLRDNPDKWTQLRDWQVFHKTPSSTE